MTLSDPLTAVYLLTSTGAAVFFGAGVAFGRITRRGRQAVPLAAADGGLGATEAELSSLRFELETTRAELEAARQRERTLGDELGVARGTLVMVDELRHAIDDKRQALELAQARLAQLQHELDDARQQGRSGPLAAAGPAPDLLGERDAARAQNQRLQSERQAALSRADRSEARAAELTRERDAALSAQRGVEARAAELTRERDAALSAQRGAEARAAELTRERDRATEALVGGRAAERERDAAVAALSRAEALIGELTLERDELQVHLETSRAYVLRSQEASAKHAAELLAAAGEARELRIRLAHAEARAEQAARLEEQNRELRDRLAALPAVPDSERLAETDRDQRKLRLDNELLVERIRQLETEREELIELRSGYGELEGEAQKSRELRRRVETLEARLYALGDEHASEGPPSSVVREGNVASQLLALVDGQRVRTVVVADRHGLLVDAAGDRTTEEGLAAVTGLAGQLALQAGQLLPLAEVCTVQLTDANHVELVCRLFQCGEDAMALATIGRGTPPEGRVEGIVATVQASLEPAPLDGPVWGR